MSEATDTMRVIEDFIGLGQQMMAFPEDFDDDLIEAYASEAQRLGGLLLRAAREKKKNAGVIRLPEPDEDEPFGPTGEFQVGDGYTSKPKP